MNAHPRGSLVRFQRIAGHRDADFTDCPGGALYALLPQIRRAVAALLPAARDLLTLSPGRRADRAGAVAADRPARAGERATAGGRGGARGAAGTRTGRWRSVARTRTGADGIWSATPTLLVNGPLRAVATLPDGRERASQVVEAQVRAGVRLRARAGTPARAAGRCGSPASTSPPKGRVHVRIERRTRTGAYRRVRTRRRRHEPPTAASQLSAAPAAVAASTA